MTGPILAFAEPFLLALARTGGFFVTVPVLGSASIPVEARVALAFLTAILVLPAVRPGLPSPPDSAVVFGLAIVLESLLGVILGFTAQLVAEGFRLCGEMLGTEIGFGMISVLDPESLVEESLLDIFMFFLFLLVFLGLDFHHRFLEAMAESFKVIPAGAMAYPPAFLAEILDRSAGFFVVGLNLALPVVAPLVIVTVALGIVSKSVPRMEVFILSFPIKIFLGFFLFAVMLPRLPAFAGRLLEDLMRWIRLALPGLAG